MTTLSPITLPGVNSTMSQIYVPSDTWPLCVERAVAQWLERRTLKLENRVQSMCHRIEFKLWASSAIFRANLLRCMNGYLAIGSGGFCVRILIVRALNIAWLNVSYRSQDGGLTGQICQGV
ncbi:hypothetical protein NP493_527g05023 [Ridgeia piscesae]|uniref:Uncharacterized protein n=1 Tax=Ridgeia piscesae TaxID=27915 RepID=A0AAD9KWV3_RIDPI|nr:hypothetical protein NP493_527g05023 [Ridgeia piscesae]